MVTDHQVLRAALGTSWSIGDRENDEALARRIA
jgi:hypothetical protein